MPEQHLNVPECRLPTLLLDLFGPVARQAECSAHCVGDRGDELSRVLYRHAEARSTPVLMPDAQHD
jgi:hypothetical protein